ncbi:endonuclease/exonuclease/phosphatase family protein [Amycolatopsis sp. NPDC101161]|uniref:endonuclease/exonuclease/phosphatase family protein n=1 Tax=Amycolatopsis sp. NPDC101161 TaxID=3363940 RepID=UPI00381B5237
MITIGTWNLENLFRPGGDGPRTPADYDAKIEALRATITGINPDVLAVQEVGDPEALTDLAKALDGNLRPTLSQLHDARGIRVGFLSRHPLTVVDDTITLPDDLAPIQVADLPTELSYQLGRSALTVTVEPAAGVVLTLITCHLKSKLLTVPGGRFGTDDEDERARYGAYALYRRTAEAVAVRELATAALAAGDDQRVVVLGDLNDEPAATTQILQGPTGSEIGTRGFDHPDGGDPQRLWNLAPLHPGRRALLPRLPGPARTDRPHLRQPRPPQTASSGPHRPQPRPALHHRHPHRGRHQVRL